MTEYVYNKAGFITSMKNMKNDTVNDSYKCRYYQNGMKISEESTHIGPDNVQQNSLYKTYYYDDLGRLKVEFAVQNNNAFYNSTYSYDLRGNRISSYISKDNSVGTEVNYTYDLNDRLADSTFEDRIFGETDTTTGGTHYRYDNNGNLISEQKYTHVNGSISSGISLAGSSSGSGIKIYSYDKFNQLSGYYDGASVASYTYNADGLRVSKTVNGSKTTFTWNGQNLACEVNGDFINTYTYDVTGISSAVVNGVYRTYMKDTHGSVVGYYNANGERMPQYEYDAFGNRLKGSDPDPFGYCGEYYDSESGNIYLRARYYNSETGRFISEDPAKDGVNWYVYCSGNPVKC